MKKALFTLAAAALLLSTASFAQKTPTYAITNDDNPNGNTATIFSYNGSTLSTVQTLSTGGYGSGGGYFAVNRNTVSSGGGCLFVSDSGSNDIAAFQSTGGGMYNSTPSVVSTGDIYSYYGYGMVATPDNKWLYVTLDYSEAINVFSIGSNCALTFKATAASNVGDYVGPLAVTNDGSTLVVSGPNNSFINSYTINDSNGGLTLLNQVSLSSVSSCSVGCYPTGLDISIVKSGKATVVAGNATLSGPYYIQCSLSTTSGLSACSTSNVPGGLANIESPVYNKAGYSGSATGAAIILGAAGFGSGYPAGVSLNRVNGSGSVTATPVATYVNAAGYYCSSPGVYSPGPTNNYIWQSCVNTSLVNTQYLYKYSRGSLTNIASKANPNANGNTYVLTEISLPGR